MAISALEERVARNTAFQIDMDHCVIALCEFHDSGNANAVAQRMRLEGLISEEQVKELNMTIVTHALNEFYKTKELPVSVFFKESKQEVMRFYDLLTQLINEYRVVTALIALRATNTQLAHYMISEHFRHRDWMRLRIVLKAEVLAWRKAALNDDTDIDLQRQIRPNRLRPAQKLAIQKHIEKSLGAFDHDDAQSIIDLCVAAKVDIAQLRQLELFN
jgi:hypothetical protein